MPTLVYGAGADLSSPVACQTIKSHNRDLKEEQGITGRAALRSAVSGGGMGPSPWGKGMCGPCEVKLKDC